MVETVPIYLAYVNVDSNGHICVGVDPTTICGEQSITSAVQIADSNDLMSIIDDNSQEICDECEDRWDSIADKVSSEQTVECHRCKSEYPGSLARMVRHQTDGDKPVCRPCYKELLDNNNSGISIPYEEAEPFRSVGSSHNRNSTFELNEE